MEDILFQLDISWQLFLYHVDGLTEQEAFWCKTEKGLQIRKKGEKWVPDWPDSEEYGMGPSSIAWILWHMMYWWKKAMAASFGDKTAENKTADLKKEDIVWPGSARRAVGELVKLHDVWVYRVSQMRAEDLRSSEYCKWPFTGKSFYSLALWLNVELMKNAAEIGSARFLYAVSEKSQKKAEETAPINDYVFMKLGTASDVAGNPMDGFETMAAYMRSIEQYGETWFSTMSLSSGMARKKVEYYNNAIRSGRTVKMLFAIGEGINDVKYAATIQEIVSDRKEMPCPGDARVIPPEFGAGETAKMWFRLTDLKEEDQIRASMLWFRETGNNVKEVISSGQCHFGYVFLQDE